MVSLRISTDDSALGHETDHVKEPSEVRAATADLGTDDEGDVG